MAEQPQSGDGLVFPEGFPCRASQIDAETIESAGGLLRSMGVTVDSHMDSIVSLWNGLPAVYAGPGAEQAYGVMAPAATASDTLREVLGKAADAIEVYAEALTPIKTELSALEGEASAFREAVLAGEYGENWKADQAAIDANRGYLERYAAVFESLTTAAATCANTVNGLLTGICVPAVEAISADAIMASGEMMPWGAPVEKDRNCGESVVHGAGNFLKSTWDGATAMVGFGEDGWSLDNLSRTWVGVADFVGSTALLASPALSETIKLFGNDDVDAWVGRRHDVAKTALTSMIGYDYQAAQQGGDGWHRWKEDPIAALTESVLNVGTIFIPGAGAAGAGLKIASKGGIAAKTVNIVAGAADFVIPGGGWAAKGGVRVINAATDAAGLTDDAARAAKLRPNPTAAAAHTPVSEAVGLGRPQGIDVPTTNTPPGSTKPGASETPDLMPGERHPEMGRPTETAPGGRTPDVESAPEAAGARRGKDTDTDQSDGKPDGGVEPEARRGKDTDTHPTSQPEAEPVPEPPRGKRSEDDGSSQTAPGRTSDVESAPEPARARRGNDSDTHHTDRSDGKPDGGAEREARRGKDTDTNPTGQPEAEPVPEPPRGKRSEDDGSSQTAPGRTSDVESAPEAAEARRGKDTDTNPTSQPDAEPDARHGAGGGVEPEARHGVGGVEPEGASGKPKDVSAEARELVDDAPETAAGGGRGGDGHGGSHGGGRGDGEDGFNHGDDGSDGGRSQDPDDASTSDGNSDVSKANRTKGMEYPPSMGYDGREIPRTVTAGHPEAPRYGPDDVDAARQRAVDPETGQPVDPRTGEALNEADGKRSWVMHWDPEGQQWIGMNRGSAVEFPDYDPKIAETRNYASQDGLLPGDHPPHTPKADYDPSTGDPGVRYYNRSNGQGDAWKDYQQQIAGWQRTPDGLIPEYVIPGADGNPVAFDGHTFRGDPPQEVFLDAKRGYKALHYAPHSDKGKGMSKALLKEAEKQVAALPPGAVLEWHVSTREGADAIAKLFDKNDVSGIDVVFTPER